VPRSRNSHLQVRAPGRLHHKTARSNRVFEQAYADLVVIDVQQMFERGRRRVRVLEHCQANPPVVILRNRLQECRRAVSLYRCNDAPTLPERGETLNRLHR
jgi:hypothetical protein